MSSSFVFIRQQTWLVCHLLFERLTRLESKRNMGLPTVRVGDIRPWFNRDAGDVDRRLLLIGLGLVAWAVWAASTSFLHQSKYILPNPIPGVPFFGNSFQMPLEGQGPFATKLAEKTGEMYAHPISLLPPHDNNAITSLFYWSPTSLTSIKANM